MFWISVEVGRYEDEGQNEIVLLNRIMKVNIIDFTIGVNWTVISSNILCNISDTPIRIEKFG